MVASVKSSKIMLFSYKLEEKVLFMQICLWKSQNFNSSYGLLFVSGLINLDKWSIQGCF